MPAEKLSRYSMYGDEKKFRRLLAEGYTECTVGGGPWIETTRLVGVWAFFHPNGTVQTVETWKHDDGMATSHSRGERTFTNETFTREMQEWKVELSERMNVAELIETAETHRSESR